MRHHLGYLFFLAVPAALVLHWVAAGPLVTFAVAALGIIPLAALMGRATENLAGYLGPHFGGLLSATFGNAAELILGLVALRRGLIDVVKASVIGSILGNALLVLGLSLLVGGLRNGRQTFDRNVVGLQATLLVLAAFALIIPSVPFAQGPNPPLEHLSEAVAGILLITYFLNLLFAYLTSGRDEDVVAGRKEPHEPPAWSARRALGLLVLATGLVTLLSEVLVGSIEEAQRLGYLEALGMTEIFLGVVLLAILGNAAENSTAVRLAYANKMDLALGIAVGSSLQIALLVMPLLLFGSLVLAPEPMDLHFTLMEVLAVSAAALILHLVAADGQGHWMEGVLLLALYLIVAAAFYYLPAPVENPSPV